MSSAEQGLPEALAGWVDNQLQAFAEHRHDGLLAASGCDRHGDNGGKVMEAEVCKVAVAKGNPDCDDRRAYRHGTKDGDGSVTLGSRRMPVRRPQGALDRPGGGRDRAGVAPHLRRNRPAGRAHAWSRLCWPGSTPPVGRPAPRDGFTFGEHELVGALRVTADGTKMPLGVVEGTS